MKNFPTCLVVRAATLLLMGASFSSSPTFAATPAPVINPVVPATAPANNAALAALDALLDQLDTRGQTLESFTATVKLLEFDDNLQLGTTREGKVWYQRLADGGARIRVSFVNRIDEQKNTSRVEPIDYVLDGGWLIERNTNKKIQIRRQVLRPGEKINLLKLGEGPFPLPIGQKKEEVKKQFEATLIKPEKTDPAGTQHLLLKPAEGSAFKRKFSAIDVWVDSQTQMPAKIVTLDSKATVSRTTELKDLKVNPKLTNEDFALPKVDETQWAVREEPFKE